MENIGNRLKNLREKFGFTQEDIAKLLGVQRLVITSMELGKRKITASELYLLSKIYGLSMEELYTGEDREKLDSKYLRLINELSDKDKEDVISFIKFKKYQENI